LDPPAYAEAAAAATHSGHGDGRATDRPVRLPGRPGHQRGPAGDHRTGDAAPTGAAGAGTGGTTAPGAVGGGVTTGRCSVRAVVLGAGSWGTAYAKVLADAGNDVTLWA